MKLIQIILIFNFLVIPTSIFVLPSHTKADDSLSARTMNKSELIAYRDSLIDNSISLLHKEQFESVFKNCDLLIGFFPDDPVGYFIKADAYGTIMRDYRIRIYESQFDSLLEITITKAEAANNLQPSPENVFILGAALGYKSLHKFRKGERLSAVFSGIKSLGTLSDALRMEPDFVDPVLGIALYEYGKIKIKRKIPWRSGKNYSDVMYKLETVNQEARFVRNNALYSMQMIYYDSKNMNKAFEINSILLERFPKNPSVLYNRALILENIGRTADAINVWRQLISRINSRALRSNGYLAECHYRLAVLYLSTEMFKESEQEITSAANYFARYNRDDEMDGPYESNDKLKKEIIKISNNHQ